MRVRVMTYASAILMFVIAYPHVLVTMSADATRMCVDVQTLVLAMTYVDVTRIYVLV